MTTEQLIKDAHDLVKRKGFWDKERDPNELLMLIISECGEALEAHRKGKRATVKWMDAILDVKEVGPVDGTFSVPGSAFQLFAERSLFENHIKDTFEDELADIVIRIADVMGSYNWKVRNEPNVMKRTGNVGASLLYVTKLICADNMESLETAMMEVFGIANGLDIDLWKHIELKMAYNNTRPYKHGKAY